MNEITIPEKSKRFTFDKTDVMKILKGALVAGIGAGVAALAQELKGIDFGEYTLYVSAGCAVLVNIVRKWVVGK